MFQSLGQSLGVAYVASCLIAILRQKRTLCAVRPCIAVQLSVCCPHAHTLRHICSKQDSLGSNKALLHPSLSLLHACDFSLVSPAPSLLGQFIPPPPPPPPFSPPPPPCLTSRCLLMCSDSVNAMHQPRVHPAANRAGIILFMMYRRSEVCLTLSDATQGVSDGASASQNLHKVAGIWAAPARMKSRVPIRSAFKHCKAQASA